ncbi:sigma-70 family RNA polymerase sigma factor [Paenibacillus sp. JCM 10914]|uniref:sigma-70 family RNA polymerase sigma factor n=1 Tax=Paenibacillus sp. JCM 10914 TaxID=1236974 RepID=UPI0003CC96DC|nr:sigma-70 family RNA polymerase sigma factor [Paenibacillus sp. JCM 10914]GAE09551.1 RNA polymerase sigma factor SigV [Paenibacillus sp. JCM 10914]
MSELRAEESRQAQFSKNIEKCRNKLYRVAYCYVKNEQEALDIVSEATYKGYLAYERMITPQYFDSWMTRIVINAAIDHLGRRKRVTYMEDQTQDYAAAEHVVPLEEKLDLYDALDRLHPEEKTYIILKFFEDLRFRDMADVLSLSENTVKTRFYRIIGKLKSYLNEGEVDHL